MLVLALAGCAAGDAASEANPAVQTAARARGPMAVAGCFDLRVGDWDREVEPGRSHFSLPPSIVLRFNFHTDEPVNDNYRLEPTIVRGEGRLRGRWVYQGGAADSVKLLWSDGEEGVLILSEPLSNESMTGVAVATFAGDAEPAARAPVSMLRKECGRQF